jgi:hypothetical protein
VPYRDAPDALRERIEQIERELAQARKEGARVPALARELSDLRRRLSRSAPRRRWPFWLAGSALALLLAGGVLVRANRRAVVGEEVERRAPPPVPPNLLVTPEVASCLARLPRAPDFRVLTDFVHAAGGLRVTWTMTPLPAPPTRDPLVFRNDDMRVRLGLGLARRALHGVRPSPVHERTLGAGTRRILHGGRDARRGIAALAPFMPGTTLDGATHPRRGGFRWGVQTGC